jgi:hypothetical protein
MRVGVVAVPGRGGAPRPVALDAEARLGFLGAALRLGVGAEARLGFLGAEARLGFLGAALRLGVGAEARLGFLGASLRLGVGALGADEDLSGVADRRGAGSEGLPAAFPE